jgi:hypothetical protein
MSGRAHRRYGMIAAPALALVAGGCDPVINVFGSFFPAWVVCMVVGTALTLALRPLFVVLGLERHLGPLLLVYPSLGLLLTMLTWLVFFHT